MLGAHVPPDPRQVLVAVHVALVPSQVLLPAQVTAGLQVWASSHV
jgi:hypothetical protein